MCSSTPLRQPPRDVLLELIPLDVRDTWRGNPKEDLTHRLRCLSASGPSPSDLESPENGKAYLSMLGGRATRAAWETYLYSAFACGFFEGEKGKDLRGRLASREASDFRSAIAECMACWFLASELHLSVAPDAEGKERRVLDMSIVMDTQESIGVEVKAPYRECKRDKSAYDGHDGERIAEALRAANDQFPKDGSNLLVLVPELRRSVCTLRVQLISPLYGQECITIPFDTRTGSAAGPIGSEFRPDGKFLKLWPVKPRFTRVSAVLVIEKTGPRYEHKNNQAWFEHTALVAHNPHARNPLDPSMFGDLVQFRNLGDGYGWSDGEPL